MNWLVWFDLKVGGREGCVVFCVSVKVEWNELYVLNGLVRYI